MRTTSIVSLIAAASLTGCYPHVQLPSALPLTAPFADRMAMFDAYRPVGFTHTIIHTRSGTSRQLDHAVLANGVEVRDPRDFVPLVGDGADTARLARRSQRFSTITWSTIGAVVTLEGAGVGLVYGSFNGGGQSMLLTGLTACGAGVLGIIVGIVFNAVANGSRERAFESYEAGLAGRLGICSTPFGAPMDCATGAALAPPPVPDTLMPPMISP